MLLWALQLSAWAMQPSVQPGVLRLDAGSEWVDPWTHVRVLAGLPDSASLSSVQEPAGPASWAAAPATRGNLGPQRSTAMLEFHLQATAAAAGDWILSIDYPSLDHLEVEIQPEGGAPVRWLLGDLHPYSLRPIHSRAYAVPLKLEPEVRSRIRLLARSTGSLVVPVLLSRPEAFRLAEARESLLQGLMAGAMVCLLVYALAQWWVLKEQVYLYYALNVLGTGTFFFSYFGMGLQHLWGDLPWLAEKATMLAGLLGLAGAFLYVEAVLDVRQHAPRLSLAMRLLPLVLLGTLLAFSLDWIGYRSAHLVNVSLSPAPLLLALPMALRRARAGDRLSRYLLVGWGLYGACTACFSLLQAGRLDSNFWTQHAFQFGTLGELALWMLLLGLRTDAQRRAGEQARAERDQLDALAHTDALTGLLNRRGLGNSVARILETCSPEHPAAVYVIDLDGFKPINDLHGHEAGDAVLRQLGQRLRQALRREDLVARIGGDEFVVVAAHLNDPEAAQAVGAKLLEVSRRPFEIDARSLTVGMTIGYAMAPEQGTQLQLLIRAADAAMYAGKQAGRGRLLCSNGRPAPQEAQPTSPDPATAPSGHAVT
jgi:diguanylate cyclase (GGDEF)-like protein